MRLLLRTISIGFQIGSPVASHTHDITPVDESPKSVNTVTVNLVAQYQVCLASISCQTEDGRLGQ